MKKNAKYFLTEGALIVFSILLALGANEWRLRAFAEAEAERAAAAIHAELVDNLELFQGLPEYHRDLAEALQQDITNLRTSTAVDDRSAIEIFSSIAIVRPTIIINRFPERVAWDLAKQRGVISRFEYELARGLSRTYGSQNEGVVPLIAGISDNLSASAMIKTENQASALWPLAAKFSELAAHETTLIGYYKKEIAALEIAYPALAQLEKDEVIFTPVEE